MDPLSNVIFKNECSDAIPRIPIIEDNHIGQYNDLSLALPTVPEQPVKSILKQPSRHQHQASLSSSQVILLGNPASAQIQNNASQRRYLRYQDLRQATATPHNRKSNRVVSFSELEIAKDGDLSALSNRVVSLPEKHQLERMKRLQHSAQLPQGSFDEQTAVSLSCTLDSQASSPLHSVNLNPSPDAQPKESDFNTRGRSETGDWPSWMSSPPRPIPALHGPLSLPYARCPSGAEGTLIDEASDLPRMIWGLENEASAQKRSSQGRSDDAKPRAIERSFPPSQSDFRPAVSFPSLSDQPPTEVEERSPYPARETPSLSIGHTTQQRLPAQARIFIGPRMSAQIPLAPSGMSAFDLAQQYRNQQFAQATQISPPSSSSTQWTPVLSTYSDALDTPEPREHFFPAIREEEHHSYIAHGIQGFGYEQAGGAGLNVHNVDLPIESLELLKVSNMGGVEPPGFRTSLKTIHQGMNTETTLSPQTYDSPQVPYPDDTSRIHTEQHPRSVPLAKLIQRRLATVPEEGSSLGFSRGARDAPTSVNPLTPRSLNAPYFQNQNQNQQPLRTTTALRSWPRQGAVDYRSTGARSSPNPTEAAILAARAGMERSTGLGLNVQEVQPRRYAAVVAGHPPRGKTFNAPAQAKTTRPNKANADNHSSKLPNATAQRQAPRLRKGRKEQV